MSKPAVEARHRALRDGLQHDRTDRPGRSVDWLRSGERLIEARAVTVH